MVPFRTTKNNMVTLRYLCPTSSYYKKGWSLKCPGVSHYYSHIFRIGLSHWRNPHAHIQPILFLLRLKINSRDKKKKHKKERVKCRFSLTSSLTLVLMLFSSTKFLKVL